MFNTNVQLKDLKHGQHVTIQPYTGQKKVVKVTEVEEDIKKGFPGIVWESIDGSDGGWCYLDQVIQINR